MGTILIIILVLLLLGALPTWPYSGSWGYYPSGGLGLVLLIVVILALTAARVVPPAAAVGPRWKRAEQKKHQKHDQNCSHLSPPRIFQIECWTRLPAGASSQQSGQDCSWPGISM